ncbi:MAG TPA: hypothetical protein PKH05_18855, partial [Nitrospira sp.]|nr:hypothetical protein [Nitrospira sp.]
GAVHSNEVFHSVSLPGWLASNLVLSRGAPSPDAPARPQHAPHGEKAAFQVEDRRAMVSDG